MGFIQQVNSKVTLVAFLTQKGREYLVSGQAADFRPRYFAPGDPDTNYLQASQNTPQGPNILPSGFVPDLSGDYSGAIHSLAGGVGQRSFLRGGTGVAQMGTNGVLGGAISAVGFGSPLLGSQRVTAGASPGVIVNIQVPLQVLRGVAGGEQVRLTVAPPARGTSAAIYPYLGLSNAGIVRWEAGEAAQKTALLTLSLPILPPITTTESNEGGYRFFAVVHATPYRSSVQVPLDTALFAVEIFLTVTTRSLTPQSLTTREGTPVVSFPALPSS